MFLWTFLCMSLVNIGLCFCLVFSGSRMNALRRIHMSSFSKYSQTVFQSLYWFHALPQCECSSSPMLRRQHCALSFLRPVWHIRGGYHVVVLVFIFLMTNKVGAFFISYWCLEFLSYSWNEVSGWPVKSYLGLPDGFAEGVYERANIKYAGQFGRK